MSGLLAQTARGMHPLMAGAFGTIGALLGGGVYLHFAGIVMGLVAGLGIAGIAVLVAWLIATATGALDGDHVRKAPAAVSYGSGASVAAPSPAALPTSVMAFTPSKDMQMADDTSNSSDASQTEAQLLAAGRFDEYHLSKAKRLFAAKEYKEAAYQAGASMSHGDIPEAKELRKAALAALR